MTKTNDIAAHPFDDQEQKMKDLHTLSFDDFDEAVTPHPETNDFDAVVSSAMSQMSRRGFIGGVLAMGSFATLGGTTLPNSAHAATPTTNTRFAFDAIAAGTSDKIVVPKGYSAKTVIRWGDPLWSDGGEFDPATRGTAATQLRAFGDNSDGMDIFTHGDKTLLAVNNEYTNRAIIWGNRHNSDLNAPAPTLDDIEKGMLAHGVTIVELTQGVQGWTVVKDSPFNRRITPRTQMAITGPAAGHDLMKTAEDPDGTTSRGTWNNCGNGLTPWGTYLTCEENFNGYFSTTDKDFQISPELARYGISPHDWGYGWSQIDARFDISKSPNEPNRAGYVVEIDPRDPSSTPKKRTALGRFKHENAECVINMDGRLVIYMGDDERGEFLYRYVSDNVYFDGCDTDDLMENGTLFAAKFGVDGLGEWRALTPQTTGMTDIAEICIHTRIAASLVKATTMDRPEWVAANPHKPELYCALTNNKNRGIKPNKGGDATPIDGPNPREGNKYGQIIRWKPTGGNHAATGFAWDLYVIAGNPMIHKDANGGSKNFTTDNMFNAPDGLNFSDTGLLWIQTDGKYSNAGDFAGHGNNQMLAGDPVTGEIRRFMTGPNECEITGLTWSTDKKTMFVGIQHPGKKGNSNWPDGGNSVPRSAVIAVTRDDNGPVG